MLELVDSFFQHYCHADSNYPDTCSDMTTAYAKAFSDTKDLVSIWEIGNEVNGEWTGWKGKEWENSQITVERMEDMRAQVAKEVFDINTALKKVIPDAKTALTLYYNDDGENHGWTDDLKQDKNGNSVAYGENYSMVKWAEAHRTALPDVDYVLLSYYEDDNDDVKPNRNSGDVKGLVKSLIKLSTLFKEAQIGFGEFAPQCNYNSNHGRQSSRCVSDQSEFIQRYYLTLDKKVRKALFEDLNSGWDKSRVYMGGYFYWYFSQDAVDYPDSRTVRTFRDIFGKYYK